MNLDEYQKEAFKFARFESDIHPLLALAEEVGELTGIFAKAFRGDDLAARYGTQEKLLEAVMKEAGDVLWQLAALLSVDGISLEQVAQMNLDKLKDRAERGVIKGSGDDR